MQDFLDRIKRMNDVFELESNDTPTDLGISRVEKFHSILLEEVSELKQVVPWPDTASQELRLIEMADFLADVVVYAASEARRWGIPLREVLDAVMDSQESKLIDGKAIKDERGKFLKGPKFEPPEKKIRTIIKGNKNEI